MVCYVTVYFENGERLSGYFAGSKEQLKNQIEKRQTDEQGNFSTQLSLSDLRGEEEVVIPLDLLDKCAYKIEEVKDYSL